MSFWRGETLKKRGATVIDSFDERAVDCNAYTLHMGSQYFCTSDGKKTKYPTPQELGQEQIFVVPPGQFAFLRTKEIVTIPDDAMAFISMKATYKFEGLINVSGFHVDPGYKGHLIFSAFNAGPNPLYLREGMPLFLIWFASLDDTSAMIRPPGREKLLSRELIRNMGPILSLQSITEKIYKIDFRTSVQYTLFGVAVVFFMALFATVFGHWYDPAWFPPATK